MPVTKLINKKPTEVIVKKPQECMTKVKKSPIQHHLSRKTLEGVIYRSLAYTLPEKTFTKAQGYLFLKVL